MSFLNKIFQSIPVKIPDRSGFDLSHECLSTAKVGTVVPITHIEVMPGDSISMGTLMKVTLPPMAVPFMGRIDAELTAAFIPYRLLWNGWQSFITQNNGFNPGAVTPTAGSLNNGQGSAYIDSQANQMNVPYSVPLVNMNESTWSSNLIEEFSGAGSLADYLGYKRISNGLTPLAGDRYLSALPFLAYHKFCDDWIRDENNMRPFFPKMAANTYMYSPGNVDNIDHNYFSPGLLPTDCMGGYRASPGMQAVIMSPLDESIRGQYFTDMNPNFPVTYKYALGSLRQRCWAKDYFTTATTRPQAGAASSVVFDTSGSTGAFTISTLRAASQLQKWMERNNIAGTDYGSILQAHFGVKPPDAVLQRSVLLGSVRTPVYVGSVENNTGTGAVDTGGDPVGTKSPYGNTLGAAGGFASAADKGTLVDNFTAHEHGVIMVFFTLIPHAYYNTGVDRQLLHLSVGDFAWPEFANIGDQEIRTGELTVAGSLNPGSVFGYNQRYSEYKFKGDRISGLVRDGENMSVYALQRGFTTVPALGSDFLEIPTDFLDQVFGVSSTVSGFGCMIDAYFDCQALRILPEYSLPSLCLGDI